MENQEEPNQMNNFIPFNLLEQILFQRILNMGSESESFSIMKIFKKIDAKELLTQENTFYNKIYKETKEISLYLDESINNFHLLFDKNLKDFEDCLKYIESISIPNKCVCAGVIETIPGWRCSDCSKYGNSIYCNDCYLKSKHLHKNHKVYFLYSSSGMCDCGDPNSLYTYCPEHSGPFKDQEQINDYISKVFPSEILQKLNEFFEIFFIRFSKYLVLTEKCELFCKDFFIEKFENNNINDKKLLENEKEDVLLLKKNFCIVYQNLLHFLRLISQKNLGMLHLIANYFLKNYLEKQKLDDEYLATHRCINISEDSIKLLYSDKEKHICLCPFLRLFMTNYRDDIKCKKENEEFILSFPHNLLLKKNFCIIYFATFKQMILNNNKEIINNKNQFYSEDFTSFIAKKSSLIEENYEIFYDYILKNFRSDKIKNSSGSINEDFIENLKYPVTYINVDTKYFSKPKIQKLMTEKTSIIKRIIDTVCLIHNQNEFKSIFPHPEFQEKRFSLKFFEFELQILGIVDGMTMYIEWDKIDILKTIFLYLIDIILNQEKKGIKVLGKDEYTYHLGLYRCFGTFLNSFCFNYAFNKKCSLFKAIKDFKEMMFESQNDVETLVDIILKDYFKLFGFIAGSANNYFNYYDSVVNYSKLYFLIPEAYLRDFSLIKYLFIMTENNIDIISFLKESNIENVFDSFEKAFILKTEIIRENIENPKENKTKCNNIDNNEEQPTELNLNLLEMIRNQNQGNLNSRAIQQFIYNNIERNKEKKSDEYNCLMQWILLLDIIISFIKDDSCLFWNLMNNYKEALSSETQRNLFNGVKKNNFAMQDLKNILKEKLIHEIIAQGNLTNFQNITKNIDKYLQILFEENNEFNKILDELTYNKMNGDIKMFYLKDTYFKYMDLNYYFSNKEKSNAQKYILDFKKDVVKSYNYYYYNPSELTFDFFETVFSRILLNKNNLDLMVKIIEKLFDNQNIIGALDIKSVRNSFLPIILNYLTMFSVINSKSFIEFKIKNKDLINKLYELLSHIIKSNSNNNLLEKDLEENVTAIINRLNWFEIIYENINEDLSKLKAYDYNTEYLEKIKDNQKIIDNNSNKIKIIMENVNKNDDNKQKNKNLKDKFKNLMKKKANKFMNQVNSNQEMLKTINEQNKMIEKDDINNEIMCFFCRNPIKLDSLKESYGKIGLLINDFFYINSVKATIKSEFSKLTNKKMNNKEILTKVIDDIDNEPYNRIISCGHYFHTSCFKEGCDKNEIEGEFTCPLCLKNQNILIPPLKSFKDNNIFLKSENMKELFEGKIDNNKYILDNNSSLFTEDIQVFLENINLNILKAKDYISFIKNNNDILKGFFNYFENIFYINGTTFHKQQQIDTIQNIILSLRYITKANSFYITQIIKYIKDELEKLSKGPNNENLYKNSNYMCYANSFETILLSLSILFNYDQMHETFKYIIYIYLPYFVFGFYYRDLIFKTKLKILDKSIINEKMNMNDFEKYLKDNNNLIINYFNNFLKKFCLIKVITDFSNKNQEIINSFNELTLDNLFSLLDMEDFYNILSEINNNEINFIDIWQNLPKIFNENDLFFKLFGSNFDNNKILNSIFTNIKLNDKEEDINESELFIQFAPIKFELTYLDKNIFDWIERNIGKKCDICKQVTKFSFICLICGKKVCHARTNPIQVGNHARNCGGNYCLFVDMDNMNLIFWENDYLKSLFPLYVNEEGTGPKGYEIGSEYNLSREKLNLTLKNFVCNDFQIN